jgi:hypothetical protein
MIVATDDKHYKDIASELRRLNESEQTYKPEEMAGALAPLYDSGYSKGQGEGYQHGESVGYGIGYGEGQQAEYDAFWDAFQNNGTLSTYSYLFTKWPDNIFKPKYNVYPVNGTHMFDNFNTGRTPYTNLTNLFNDIGVKLDTSRCTNFTEMFYFAWINRVPEIDTRAASSIVGLFNSATRIVTVDKVILKDDGSQTLYTNSSTNCFYNCTSLVNIEFEGVIGQNIGFRNSTKLSAKSLVSIVEHLSDTASGKVVYLSTTAVNNADWSTTDYSSWDELIATKQNWSFSLA